MTIILLPVSSTNENYSGTDVAYLEINPAFKSYLRIARKALQTAKDVLSETYKLVIWDSRLGWLATETSWSTREEREGYSIFDTLDLDRGGWSEAPKHFDSGSLFHASVDCVQLVVKEEGFHWMCYLKGNDNCLETVSITWEELKEL